MTANGVYSVLNVPRKATAFPLWRAIESLVLLLLLLNYYYYYSTTVMYQVSTPKRTAAGKQKNEKRCWLSTET